MPLVVAGWGQWRRVAVGLAAAAVAFCATSPYFVVHLSSALGDALRVQRLARQGWLGFEHDHIAPIAFLDRLWEGLGPALLVCVLGLVVALVQRRRNDLILASFVIVYFLDLCTLGAHFDRYVLPLVPALGALAGRLRALAPVTLLLLVVPLTWSIRDDVRLTRTDTRSSRCTGSSATWAPRPGSQSTRRCRRSRPRYRVVSSTCRCRARIARTRTAT